MSSNPSNRVSQLSAHIASKAPTKPETYRERSLYKHFAPIQTRWSDNDMYGHINNMYDYQFINTIINEYLIYECGVDILNPASVQFIIAQSSAQFYAPLAYPSSLEGGLVVVRIGTSSVKYRVGLFKTKDDTASVVGEVTHVYVDPVTKRPVSATPNQILSKLQQIMLE